jgi:AraC-like DNA-binding protein
MVPGYVSVQLLNPLLEAVGRVGVDVETLLRDARVDPALFADGSARVPVERLRGFWAAVPLALGNMVVGLRAADLIHVNSFSLPWYITKFSATGRDALQRGQRYIHLLTNQFSLELNLEGDRAVVEFVHVHAVPRIVSEFLIALAVRTGRAAYHAREFPLLEVRFSHLAEPLEPDRYVAYFGVPVRFGSRSDALVVSTAVLEARHQHGDERLCGLLERLADQELRRISSLSGLAPRVQRELAAQLHGGNLSMELTAKRIGVNVRTLRRKLRDEGVSYAGILERLRHRLALEYLNQGRAVGEVANLLGYADVSVFSKAFKRWTGMSPAQRAPKLTTSDPEI